MGAFDHLKKDLTALTKWPGKKEGETYAQTKARQKETPSLEAALKQAPMQRWNLTQHDVLEAFVPATKWPMAKTYVRRLGRFVKAGHVVPRAAAALLLKTGGRNGLVEVLGLVESGCLPKSDYAEVAAYAVNVLLKRPAEVPSELKDQPLSPFPSVGVGIITPQATVDHSDQLLQGEDYQLLRAVRKAYPELLPDDEVTGLVGHLSKWLAGGALQSVISWELRRSLEGGLMLLRTLPGWKDAKACAEVHAS